MGIRTKFNPMGGMTSIKKNISIQLSGIGSYGWQTATVTNPTSWNMYQSMNYNVSSSQAVMKVTFSGYTSLTCYINSYAETSYDYTIASSLDASSYPTSGGYVSTSGFQYNPTTFSTSNWKTVTYTPNDTKEHYFYIVFRKDGSVNSNNDRGYFIININQ